MSLEGGALESKSDSQRLTRTVGKKNTDIPQEIRNEYQRDLDWLLYTFYFRRLAEITQVSPVVNSASVVRAGSGAAGLMHNRLTHSLKVGQVARRLAQYLQSNDANSVGIHAAGGLTADVAELAGRAHDLGHPPFGHMGEQILDRIAVEFGLADGFEGNAQTFRILASLIRRQSSQNDGRGEYAGLGLTGASLAACVKYPWKRGESGKKYKKYGFIDLDSDVFEEFVAKQCYAPDLGTLEAQVMDWADDITYATHDIEDFAVDGTIPLSDLAHKPDGGGTPVPENAYAFEPFWNYASARLSVRGFDTSVALNEFRELATQFPKKRPDGSRLMEAHLGRISSHIITMTSNRTSVLSNGVLDVDMPVRVLVEVLKQLTWFYVIDRPGVAVPQRGYGRMLEAVTREFIDWSMDAFRDKEEIDGSPGNFKTLTENELRANKQPLPPMLADLVGVLVSQNNGRGAYPEKTKNIVRGGVDFVASLREVEVEEYYRLMCT